MNKRLRKKLHKGEFRQYGFEFSVGDLKDLWKMFLTHFLQTLTGASHARTLSGLKKIPDLSACEAPDSVGLGLADYLIDLIQIKSIQVYFNEQTSPQEAPQR